MSQWGLTDNANNSPLWSAAQLGKASTRAAANTLFGNTTANAYGNNIRTGVYASNPAETGVSTSNVAFVTVTFKGSGYTANSTATFSGGGGSSAAATGTANASGYISGTVISNVGSGYETNPTVVFAAPSAITFNANTALFQDATFNALTGVANTTEFITTSSAHGFSDGDRVQYLVAASNTAVGGLTNATSYYVVSSNTSALKLSTASGGAAVNVTAGSSETGHTLRRLDYIEITSNVLQNGDTVTYKTNTGNTVITGLANNTNYFVVGANAGGVYLSSTVGGSRIALTPGASETGHSLTGETATGVASIAGGQTRGVTAGWNLRTELSNGRVRYECLIATKNISGDASDDTVLPDA